MTHNRVHFYHIHKCGGRSLIFTMMAPYIDATVGWSKVCALGQQTFGKMTFHGDPHVTTTPAFTWSHMPAHNFTLPKETFTITIFRDPVQRIASFYRMILFDILHPTLSQLERWYKYLGKDILDFTLQLPPYVRYEQIAMFSKRINLEEAIENIQTVSYYYRLKDFVSATTQLCRILGIPVKIQYASGRIPKEALSILPPINEKIETELAVHRSELTRLYECEYKLLAAVC